MDCYANSLDRSFSNRRVVWLVFIITKFIENPVFNANSVEPDQTPRSAASDLGLHYLPMSLLWDTKHKWDKILVLNLNKIKSIYSRTSMARTSLGPWKFVLVIGSSSY